MNQEDKTLTLTLITEPRHANNNGNVHGGEIMRLMDTTAGCTAIRYSKSVCVTARADELQFLKPINIGSLIICKGTIVYTGNTSIEVRVIVDTEDIRNAESKCRALEAFFTLVALDQNGKPTPVPPFTPETAREKELHELVRQRREFDLQRREEAKARKEDR
jgi:uncharacterized protein (TIGR00369 family)